MISMHSGSLKNNGVIVRATMRNAVYALCELICSSVLCDLMHDSVKALNPSYYAIVSFAL